MTKYFSLFSRFWKFELIIVFLLIVELSSVYNTLLFGIQQLIYSIELKYVILLTPVNYLK